MKISQLGKLGPISIFKENILRKKYKKMLYLIYIEISNILIAQYNLANLSTLFENSINLS